MPFTYHDLKEKTVAQLREIAKDVDHEAVKGATQRPALTPPASTGTGYCR